MRSVLTTLDRHSCCFAFVLVLSSCLESNAQQGKLKKDKPFVAINTQVLKVKFNGVDLVYPKQVVFGIGDKAPKLISQPVTQVYTVMVPYTEKVDGKTITKMRAEERTRTVTVTKLIDGELKVVPTAIDSNLQFYSLDGKKIEREKAIQRIGMKEVGILVLQDNQEIPDAWRLVMKDDILVVRSTSLFAEAYKNPPIKTSKVK